jgi:hypothetical protein
MEWPRILVNPPIDLIERAHIGTAPVPPTDQHIHIEGWQLLGHPPPAQGLKRIEPGRNLVAPIDAILEKLGQGGHSVILADDCLVQLLDLIEQRFKTGIGKFHDAPLH